MSLLWTQAAKAVPTHEENILDARLRQASHVNNGWQDKHFHEMTPEEFGNHEHAFWHGSPAGEAGMDHQAHYGLHVGTHEAAKQALEARIGRPAEGVWDGTREYGKTLLAYHGHGHGVGEHKGGDTYYPSGKATYSGGHPIPLDTKPHIFPVHIVGEMTNERHTPHGDWQANGLMAGQIKRGTARRGYYYRNEGEDYGSISAVVPNRAHVATHEDFVRHALAHGHMGRPVPDHNLERYGLT